MRIHKSERIKEISCEEALNIIALKLPIGRFIAEAPDYQYAAESFVAINNLTGEAIIRRTKCKAEAFKWLIDRALEVELKEVTEAIIQRLQSYRKLGNKEDLVFAKQMLDRLYKEAEAGADKDTIHR